MKRKEELEGFDAFQKPDAVRWKFVKQCLDTITRELLAVEAPIVYLGHQWIRAMKKISKQVTKHEAMKDKYQALQKSIAEAEMSKMLGELEVKLATNKATRLGAAEAGRKAIDKTAADKKAKDELDAAAAARKAEAAEAAEAAAAAAEAAAEGAEGAEGR